MAIVSGRKHNIFVQEVYEIKTALALKRFQLKIMIPSPVTKGLQGLTQIEDMLIVRAFPVISVYTRFPTRHPRACRYIAKISKRTSYNSHKDEGQR